MSFNTLSSHLIIYRRLSFFIGLPFTCTKTDIENIFKPYGALKDVRVVTFRNGHSKGLAYVDFEDEVKYFKYNNLI